MSRPGPGRPCEKKIMSRQAPAGPCEKKIMSRPLAVGRGAILTRHDLFFAENYVVIVFRERAGALPIRIAGDPGDPN